MSRPSLSSDCGCGCPLAGGCGSPYWDGIPFHPFADHPIVYYAQVEHFEREQREKDKPNCFVKAFRWYTQEHNVQGRVNEGRYQDTVGFALWLDRKYDQYLCDNQLAGSQLKRPARVPPLRVTSSVRVLGKKRNKSSCRKRRGENSQDGGDGCQRCDQSLEVILQPKMLSRAASECCFQNRAPTRVSTTTTVVSSDTLIINKTSIIRNHDNDETNQPHSEATVKVEDYSRKSSMLNDSNEKKKNTNNDMECQCPKTQVVKKETSTQYTISKNKIATNVAASSASPKNHVAKTETSAQYDLDNHKSTTARSSSPMVSTTTSTTLCECPKLQVIIDTGHQVQQPQQTSEAEFLSCDACEKCKLHKHSDSNQTERRVAKFPNPSPVKEEMENNVLNNMCSTVKNTKLNETTSVHTGSNAGDVAIAAQTSDHSIVLDRATLNVKPVLVRVVVADRTLRE